MSQQRISHYQDNMISQQLLTNNSSHVRSITHTMQNIASSFKTQQKCRPALAYRQTNRGPNNARLQKHCTRPRDSYQHINKAKEKMYSTLTLCNYNKEFMPSSIHCQPTWC